MHILRPRNRGKVLENYINSIKPYLIGRSPFNIKNFLELMYSDFSGRRIGMEYYCATGSIEIALWDIVGKACRQPIYNLLGGACRDKIKVYANAWTGGCRTPQDYARKASETVAKGFNALKFDPFSGPYRSYIKQQGKRKYRLHW